MTENYSRGLSSRRKTSGGQIISNLISCTRIFKSIEINVDYDLSRGKVLKAESINLINSSYLI